MTPFDRLTRIADLLLQSRLARLRESAAARDRSRMALTALDVPRREGDPVAEAQIALRYQSWADARRAEINLTLARQTADWLRAQEEARIAFGKVQVLRQMRKK
ncbi:hypothetical protein [Falsirhodobacter algicola]|uniref:Flagellar FliJ protein n=1 Tax=Falsirhodobacter algicola TaxID=2692330 RepID=A0A8J8MSF6_9RHOB|nr:hypothetical protein [Falsirhodobacter algicola]QUS35927.1 hypothetical protein GR316_06430 [Falsirhodobacter algicola]